MAVSRLRTVRLEQGLELAISLVSPPEPQVAARLCPFLSHKPYSDFRAIRQRLEGRYADQCFDRYFVAQAGERIVAQVWYGLGNERTGIGNFGHAYTDPQFRRMGIMKLLLEDLLKDFDASPGVCLLCTGEAPASTYYHQVGFEFIVPGERTGHDPMALVKKQHAANFSELERVYFAPGQSVTTRLGTIADRHDCDRMLDFSSALRAEAPRWRKVFAACRAPTFIDALYMVEDGLGIATVLATSGGQIVGHASVLNVGSPAERGLHVLDYVVHPNYYCAIPDFVVGTVALARRHGIGGMVAFAAAGAGVKLDGLTSAGFTEACRFGDSPDTEVQPDDVVMLCLR
jgi:GNAT superfamily N-acetyltransferase